MTSPKDGERNDESAAGPGPPRLNVTRAEEIAASIRPSWERLFDSSDAGEDGFRESSPGASPGAEQVAAHGAEASADQAAAAKPGAPAVGTHRAAKTVLGLAPPSAPPVVDAVPGAEPQAPAADSGDAEGRADDHAPAQSSAQPERSDAAGEKAGRARSSRRAIRPKALQEPPPANDEARREPAAAKPHEGAFEKAEAALAAPQAPAGAQADAEAGLADAVGAAAETPSGAEDAPLAGAPPFRLVTPRAGAATSEGPSSEPRSARSERGRSRASGPPLSAGEESIRLPTTPSPWGKVTALAAAVGLIAAAVWWFGRPAPDAGRLTAEPTAAASTAPAAPAHALPGSATASAPTAAAPTDGGAGEVKGPTADASAPAPADVDTAAPRATPSAPPGAPSATPKPPSTRPAGTPKAPPTSTTPPPSTKTTGGGLVRDVPF